MKKPKVFISYSQKSKDFANLMIIELKNANIEFWKDSQIQAGEDWKKTIDHNIENSDAVVVILDEHSVKSHYVTYEWAFALGLCKKVIPILKGDCENDIHPRLKDFQYLNFKNDYKWDKFISSIEETFNVNQKIFNANQKINALNSNTEKHNTILWVDDRPNNNIYERNAFENIGYKFVLAQSTNEALSLLSRKKYVAIISDMGRREGEKEGYVLLKEVRKKDKQIPFFIYAGSNLLEHKIEAQAKGAQGCTNRPDELIDLVTAHI